MLTLEKSCFNSDIQSNSWTHIYTQVELFLTLREFIPKASICCVQQKQMFYGLKFCL